MLEFNIKNYIMNFAMEQEFAAISARVMSNEMEIFQKIKSKINKIQKLTKKLKQYKKYFEEKLIDFELQINELYIFCNLNLDNSFIVIVDELKDIVDSLKNKFGIMSIRMLELLNLKINFQEILTNQEQGIFILNNINNLRKLDKKKKNSIKDKLEEEKQFIKDYYNDILLYKKIFKTLYFSFQEIDSSIKSINN